MKIKRSKMKIKIDVKGYINKVIRVLRLTTKPEKKEFWDVAKITALGMVVIGLVGYIIESLKYLLE